MQTAITVAGGGISSAQSTTYDADVIESHNVDPSENQLQYNSDLGYFYFVDGKYPQSYVGNTLNATLKAQFDITDTGNYYLTIGGAQRPVFTYNSKEYLAIVSPQTVNVKLNGASVTFSSGSTYFFAVEPIVWRVSDYGVSETECPINAPTIRTFDYKYKAVSDLVLDWGAVETGTTTEGWKYTSSDMYANINSNYGVLKSSFLYSGTSSFDFDSFSAKGKQNPVTTTYTSTSGVFQSSLSDLSTNLSDYRAYASDLVCMLAGVSDTQWCTYATRNLQNLSSGYSIGADGSSHTRWLNTNSAVRISTSYLLKKNASNLITGNNLAMAIKNSSTYDTSNSTVKKIVFDKYTAEGEYLVSGTNVISGLTAKDVSVEGDGGIMLYGSGTANVYVLSKCEIYANATSTGMFYNCEGLTSIIFNNFNTSKVTYMERMFYNCKGLTSLNLSGFNTAKVTIMNYMFYYCSSLTSLNLSNFDTSNVTNMAEMFDFCSGLTSLNVSSFDTSKVTVMNYMFRHCSSLTSLDLSNFNTSKATSLSYMFSSCSGLTSLDLSNFETSIAKDMSCMFQSCSKLTTIYVGEGWNTDAVTSSGSMFISCTNLVGGAGTTYNSSYIDIRYAIVDGGTSRPGYLTYQVNLTTGQNVAKAIKKATSYSTTNSTVTKIVFDFYTSKGTYAPSGTNLISGLTGVDVSASGNGSIMLYGGGTANVYVLSKGEIFANATSTYMFYYCQTLTSVQFNNFHTSNVTNMSYMFSYSGYSSSSLTLDLSCFDTTNVTNMQRMFYYSNGLTDVNLSSFDTAKVTHMGYMFQYCELLTSLDLSSFDTSKVTNMYQMFINCTKLKTIYVSYKWNTNAVTDASWMFSGCTSLVGGSGTVYTVSFTGKSYAIVDGGTSSPGYLTLKRDPVYLTTGQNVAKAIKNASSYSTTNSTVTKIVFDFYTSEGIYAPSGTNLISGLTGVDISSSRDGSIMLYGGGNATVYVLSEGKIFANATSTYMFYYCQTLTNIQFSNFNTSNVTNMSYMFSYSGYSSSSLTLDLSCFDTKNVTNMSYMFYYANGLTNVNLSSFDTTKVTHMGYMFQNCGKLKSLDLSNFNTANVTNTYQMFVNCPELTTIYVGNGWNTNKVTTSSYMFYGCSKLVGSAGTTYNYNNTDKTFAHVDGGTSNPGYLTYKASTSSVNEVEGLQNITTKVVWAVCGTVFAVVAGVFVWLIVLKRCRNSIAK